MAWKWIETVRKMLGLDTPVAQEVTNAPLKYRPEVAKNRPHRWTARPSGAKRCEVCGGWWHEDGIVRGWYPAKRESHKPIATSVQVPVSPVGMIAFKPGTLVKIEWANEEDDWPYFTVVADNGWHMVLRGEDYPDGSSTHIHDTFVTDRSEISSINVVRP